jgi:hypothetical protein
MRRTDAEIGKAASRFEQLADNLGPATVKADDPSDLRAVAEAADQVGRDEALVTKCAAAARAPQAELEPDRCCGISRQAALVRR